LATLLKNKDFLAGALFVAAGVIFFWIGRDYGMGTSRRMGPGYFPTVLSVILMVIGAGVLLVSLRSKEQAAGIAWRGIASVVLGTVAFGVLIRGGGILIAVAALVLISAAGNPQSRWLPMVVFAAAMAALCWLIFVKSLGLPIPVIGPWFVS
jgi:putative tricarboxylic transport membrane protein